ERSQREHQSLWTEIHRASLLRRFFGYRQTGRVLSIYWNRSHTQCDLIGLQCIVAKAREGHFMDLRMGVEKCAHLFHRDLVGAIERKAIAAGADGGEGDHLHAVLHRELE